MWLSIHGSNSFVYSLSKLGVNRESDDEIILVSIEGMPTEDVAWAYECYTYALVHDIGTKLKVWDRPYAF